MGPIEGRCEVRGQCVQVSLGKTQLCFSFGVLMGVARAGAGYYLDDKTLLSKTTKGHLNEWAKTVGCTLVPVARPGFGLHAGNILTYYHNTSIEDRDDDGDGSAAD